MDQGGFQTEDRYHPVATTKVGRRLQTSERGLQRDDCWHFEIVELWGRAQDQILTDDDLSVSGLRHDHDKSRLVRRVDELNRYTYCTVRLTVLSTEIIELESLESVETQVASPIVGPD